MTDLTVCFVNKGLILFEELLKTDFQNSLILYNLSSIRYSLSAFQMLIFNAGGFQIRQNDE